MTNGVEVTSGWHKVVVRVKKGREILDRIEKMFACLFQISLFVISKQCLCTIAISVRYTGKIDSGVTSNASGLVRVTKGAAVLAIVRWFTRSLLYYLSLSQNA